MGFQDIFPVPIYTTFLDNKLVEDLEKLVTPRLHNLTLGEEQKTDYHSKDKILSPEELSEFFHYIDPIITDYSNKSNLKRSNNINYWVQDYEKNNKHSLHAHGDSYISGVYYLRANENAGELSFFNPNPIYTITEFLNGPKNEIYFPVKPLKGLLVLFPGWLSHEALPSSNDGCIRTCLAFNYEKIK